MLRLFVFIAVFLSLSFMAAALWVAYFMAKEFYRVAKDKGYPQKKYFWVCFLLGIVGYLLVIALPDRANSNKAFSDELPDL